VALLFVVVLAASNTAHSKGVYQTGPAFITETFGSSEPQAKSLWLTPKLKDTAREIMGHRIRGIRVRYWQEGNKTAWMMEEVGKELPITIGVVVNQDSITQNSASQGHVEQVKILAFRESRGWEVRYSAFTAQYLDAKMTSEKKLDTHIDGITGATLSVRAVTKVATLALFYHQQVMSAQSQQAQDKLLQSKLPKNKETNPLVTETP
jgi:FMN-binding protein